MLYTVICFFIRPDRSPPVHYAETSMKNGFGLKYIHKFLNLPFLLLQVSMHHTQNVFVITEDLNLEKEK